jgi:putative peptidoglycan lipid II flippase
MQQAPKIKNKPPRGGHAIRVAAGILLSRIAGLIRERVFAHYLGNSDSAGAFRAALRIPNFLQNLFGEGVLSASFIPVYAKLLAEENEEMAGRVAGVVATVFALAVSLLVLLGVVFTPFFVGLVAPGFHGELHQLTLRIVRVLFPGVGLLVLSAWCLGILNSHRRFFLSYVAPVFWNLSMIATLVVGANFGLMNGDLAVALAWGTVIGSGLQFGVQLPFVFYHAPKIRFAIETTLRPAREVFKNLGPVVISRGVVQLSAYIDGIIASFLGAAAVSGLGYAQTIYLLPISLFGMSVAAAELPAMSGTVGAPEEVCEKLRTRLESGSRKIAFFVIPSVVAFLFLGKFLVGALFQTGQFTKSDTLYVWYILMGSTVGLLAATWGRLFSSTFYALRDTRTPLRFALIRVTLTAVLGGLFAFPLRPALEFFFQEILHLPSVAQAGALGMGAVGLTASAGIAGWIEFLLLKRALAEKIGQAKVGSFHLLRLWGSAIFAAIVALIVVSRAGSFHHPVFEALLPVGCFGIVYLMATYFLGVSEIKLLIRRG